MEVSFIQVTQTSQVTHTCPRGQVCVLIHVSSRLNCRRMVLEGGNIHRSALFV